MMFGPLDKLLNKSNTTSHGASAVVTGAGSGIGAAFAVELGRRGGAVVCSDIDETAAQQTVDAITEHGAKSDRNPLRRVPIRRRARFGRTVAVLVRRTAHAGDQQRRCRCRRRRHRRSAPGRLGVDAGHQPVGTHSRLPCVHPDPARSRAVTRPRGIINVASAAAFGAAPGMAAYNVSKAGVLSLSETLAAELSGTAVKVTVLCPTFVKTNIVESGRITDRIQRTGRQIDALDRVLAGQSGANLPGCT